MTNLAEGECCSGIFAPTECPPDFPEPDTYFTSPYQWWEHRAYDRKCSGNTDDGCERDVSIDRSVRRSQSCNWEGGGQWECDPVCQMHTQNPNLNQTEDAILLKDNSGDKTPFKNAAFEKFNSAENKLKSKNSALIPDPCCIWTPIVIDVLGNGFALTDIQNGVDFDWNGDGIKHRMSWTANGSDDAFLVLDRNSNGMIDSGSEMFGNLTSQPTQIPREQRNGFLALAEFDKPENGSNPDGGIDRRDSIFQSLRLWQDTNHNGISESNELRTLPEFNITAIELGYKESKRTDEYGNRFGYRTKVWDSSRGGGVGRWAWDVFLIVQQP